MGFRSPEDTDLEKITQSTGGRFHHADTPETLRDALRQSLEPMMFEVLEVGGDEPAADSPGVPVGQLWQCPDWDGPPRLVKVCLSDRGNFVESPEFRLLGGERVILSYSAEPKQLLFTDRDRFDDYSPPDLNLGGSARKSILTPQGDVMVRATQLNASVIP